MTWTPELITALCTGIVTVIASITTMIVAIINSRKVDHITEEQLPSIETKVNGNLSKALTEVQNLKTYIREHFNSREATEKAK